MVEDHLDLLYEATWDVASDAEQRELRLASGLGPEATASAIFTAIARSAGLIDPILTTHLWDELEPPRHITRIELGELELSEPVSKAVQLALAFELGQRIDRAIAALPARGPLPGEHLLRARRLCHRHATARHPHSDRRGTALTTDPE